MQMPEWAYARTKPSGCPQFARRILSNILYTLYLLLLSSLLIALARLFCFASLSKIRASHFLFKISLHTHTGHPPRTFLSLQVSPKQTSAEDFTSIWTISVSPQTRPRRLGQSNFPRIHDRGGETITMCVHHIRFRNPIPFDMNLHTPTYPSPHLPNHLTYPSIYLPTYPPICLSTHFTKYPPTYPHTYQVNHSPTHPPIHPPSSIPSTPDERYIWSFPERRWVTSLRNSQVEKK